MKKLLLILVLAVICSSVARADDLKDVLNGMKTDQKEHYLRNLGWEGNADAQYYLGLMYSTGDGVTKSRKEAEQWYQKAAEQGDARAQFKLGWMVSVSNKVYLNACGSNPQSYKSKPLNLLDKIVEVPNIIKEIKPSKYGRPFITEANSSITLPNGNRIYIQLDNFRDLKIFDHNNKVLLMHNVAGATSIYEYRYEKKVIAWGVGWHKNCTGGYPDTDFTVLRTFVPYLKNGKIKIDNQLLRPRVSYFKEFYENTKHPIFVSARTIDNSYFAAYCYYCGIEFIEINNTDGLKLLPSLADRLVDNYQIDFSSFQDLVPVLNFLSKNEENISFFKDFLKKNYQRLISNLVDEYYLYSVYSKDGWLDRGFYEVKEFESQHFKIKRYVNSDLFNNKIKFIKYFEKNCNLDNYNSFSSIALGCFPMHAFFFDDPYLLD
jgi:hypothetical protein